MRCGSIVLGTLITGVVLGAGARAPCGAGPAGAGETSTVEGEIRGFVFGPDGRPMGGVEVEAAPSTSPLMWPPDPEIDSALSGRTSRPVAARRAATGEDGAFALGGLAAHRRYRVRAVPAPPLVPSATTEEAVPEASPRVALRLSKGAPTRLRLRTAGGAGIPGQVSIRPTGRGYLVTGDVAGNEGGWSLQDLPVGADGALDVPAVPDGLVQVLAVAPDVGFVRREVLVPAEDPLAIAFSDPSGGTLECRFTGPDGEGIAGVVSAWDCAAGEGRLVRVGRADAQGRLRLTEMPVGSTSLARVVVPGHDLPDAESLRWSRIAVSAGTIAVANVRLLPAGAVTGAVRDGTGAAVSGAEVTLRLEHLAPIRTRTGADGRYSFPGLAPGKGWVAVEGFDPLEPLRIPPTWPVTGAGGPVVVAGPGGTAVRDFAVRTDRKPPLTGTVTDEAGKPLAHALVTAQRCLTAWDGQPTVSTRTDATGAFSIATSSGDRRWSVSAFAGDLRSRSETARVGGRPVHLTVSPSASASLAGRLLAADGTPLAGAEVTPCEEPSWVSGCYTGPEAIGSPVVTDADGRFAFRGLSPGRITLQVFHRGAWLHAIQRGSGFPDGSPELVWHDLAPGAHVKDVVVTGLPTGEIAGAVVDEAGRPVPGMRVRMNLVEQGLGCGREANAATDRAGRFRLPYLVEGTYSVHLEDGGMWDRVDAKVTTGTRDARIVHRAETSRRRRIAGTVTGPDGAPAYAGRITAYGARGSTERSSIVEGAFEIDVRAEEVTAGALRLMVGSACDASGTPLADADEQVEVPPDRDVPIAIRLRSARTFSGRLVDPEGRGVGGGVVVARYGLEMRWPMESELGERWTMTEQDGTFRLDGPNEGDMHLCVRPEGDWLEPAPVILPKGSASDLRIAMRRGWKLRGTVANEAGEPEQATLRVTWTRPSPGALPNVFTDDEGSFSIVVPADVRCVDLRADEGADGRWFALKFALLRDVEPGAGPLALRLTSGEVVRGTVEGPQGEPISSGWVVLLAEPEDPEARSGPFATERRPWGAIREGRFEIRGVPPGRRRAVAVPEGEEFAPSDVVPVEAPADGIRIAVPRCVEAAVVLEGARGRPRFATWQGASPAGGPMWRSGWTDPAGRVTLALPPNLRGTLYAHGTEDDRYAVAEEVSGASLSPLRVEMRDGLSVTGSVEGIEGGEAEGSTVVLTGSGIAVSTALGADARFVVRGLPPGAYEVTVEVPSTISFETRAPPQTVEAGSDGVVIRSGIRRVQRR